MKKILAILFAFAFPFLAGCTPEIIRAGGERDARLYNAQNAHKSIAVAERIALANIPACRITAKPGEEIMLSGVEVFECYGGVYAASGESDGIQQRISPFWAWSTANMGILGMLGAAALMFPDGVQSGVIDRQVVEPPAQPTQIIQQPFVVRP